MTQEEIIKKAYEVYPEDMGWWFDPTGYAEKVDLNAERREGYIKALTEVNSLPKIKGWVARDSDGCLNYFNSKPLRGEASWVMPQNPMALNGADFPDLRWEDEPIEVKLLIKKV